MRDSRSGAHPLDLSGPDDRACSHAVFVLERSFQNVGDDLHISMRMCPKTLRRGNAILINDPQGSESHVVPVMVGVEGERVVSVEPAVVGMAPLVSMTDCNRIGSLRFKCLTSRWT